MSKESNNQWKMDESVKEELEGKMSEEEIIGMFSSSGDSEERIPLVEAWMPDKDQWGGKTNFDETQPEMITLAENLPNAFPIIKPMEPLIKEFIDKYEMRLTSIEGISREQQMQVFRSMFGGGSGGEQDRNSFMEIALSASDKDE